MNEGKHLVAIAFDDIGMVDLVVAPKDAYIPELWHRYRAENADWDEYKFTPWLLAQPGFEFVNYQVARIRRLPLQQYSPEDAQRILEGREKG